MYALTAVRRTAAQANSAAPLSGYPSTVATTIDHGCATHCDGTINNATCTIVFEPGMIHLGSIRTCGDNTAGEAPPVVKIRGGGLNKI